MLLSTCLIVFASLHVEIKLFITFVERHIMKKLLALSLIAFSTAAFGQAVPKMVFKPGQGLEMTTKIVTNNKVEVMGQTMETEATTTITQKFDVEKVTETSAVIEQKIKALQFDVQSGNGQNFSFNSDKPEDLKGQMGKMMENTMKAKYKYTVDASGHITSVEEQKEKTSASDDMMAGMLSQMNAGAQAPKVGDRIPFNLLPDRELKVGDTWTTDSKSESGTRKSTYTVKQITGSDIILNLAEEATINTKQSMMGMDANVNGTSHTKGEVVVDKQTGLLKSSNLNVEGDQTMEMQGQQIPSSSKMTITTTVKSS